jgi:imidazolonepropionase-like amidohydrolase
MADKIGLGSLGRAMTGYRCVRPKVVYNGAEPDTMIFGTVEGTTSNLLIEVVMRKRISFRSFLIGIALMISLIMRAQESQESLERKRQLAHFADESRIDELVLKLSAKYRAQNIVIRDVTLISVSEGRAVPNQSVTVKDGRITAVGPSASIRNARGMRTIDGTGAYLIPGLTDMHVHQLVSSSQHLLNLMEGVTSVRDMDGFPWTLRMREAARRGELLAPNLYITGQILNGAPMGFYARVVTTPEEGRTAVSEDKAAGFDFIKVHNIMKPEVYEAVLDEAHKQNIDVVGHIPHDINVADAIRLGQKTMEHFKGYILDNSLTISHEDYVSATKGADIWLCPTFSTYRTHLSGADVLRTLELPEMRYTSWRDRINWKKRAEEPVTPQIQAQQRILPMSEQIFKELLPIGARFIAGTDSGGGYAMMPPGFILHEELRIMQKNGLSPLETLRSATTNAAAAMSRASEFGSIEPGKRADMVLLSANPLLDSANLDQIQAVIVRGIVLDRKGLNAIDRSIRAIYDPQPAPLAPTIATRSEVERMIERMERLHRRGFVFRTHNLKQLEQLLQEEGQTTEAAKVAGMQ